MKCVSRVCGLRGRRCGRAADIPAAANAANEAAVNAFLTGRIGFCDIPALIEAALGAFDGKEAPDLDRLTEIDAAARRYVIRKIGE